MLIGEKLLGQEEFKPDNLQIESPTPHKAKSILHQNWTNIARLLKSDGTLFEDLLVLIYKVD